MTRRRLLAHSFFLLLLPLVVAWFDISVGGAVVLVVIALVWHWAISLSGIVVPEKVPELELDTIAASHFAEKTRWCMDRLGVEYTERQTAGMLNVFFAGRTVPRLKIRTGIVRSMIGNSPEILRYLWGSYAATLGDKAKFLEPTEDRLALEKRIDRYGVNLQVWVYHHILDDRELTQHAWGCNSSAIPAWQRYTVVAFFPVLRALLRKTLRISDARYAGVIEHIESLLAEIDARLADGQASILGGEEIDYVDITFASLSALWLQPQNFARDMADQVRIRIERMPPGMRADVERWTKEYRNATGLISDLYERER